MCIKNYLQLVKDFSSVIFIASSLGNGFIRMLLLKLVCNRAALFFQNIHQVPALILFIH